MAKKRWQPGAVIRSRLSDGWTYYARLLEFPWVAFYRHRTQQPSTDAGAIIANPVLFTIAVHKDLLGKGGWEVIGERPLEGALRPPAAQAIWDVIQPGKCRIVDAQGEMRDATPEECKGLEPAAVWEPPHVADRLMDAFAGRPNKWLESVVPAGWRS